MDEAGLPLVETLRVEGDRARRYSARAEPPLQPCTKDLDGLAEQKNRSVPLRVLSQERDKSVNRDGRQTEGPRQRLDSPGDQPRRAHKEEVNGQPLNR